MTQHELVLLSPYRFPAQSSMQLANDEMAGWLNAYTALWHPALLCNAKEPPRIDAQYDHEQPRTATVYAIPEAPSLYLPDDWEERVRAAGSITFRAGSDRSVALDNLRAALTACADNSLGWPAGLYLALEQVGPFFGLGLGYLLQATLADAMEHENLLDRAGFWNDVQEAVKRSQESGDRNPETQAPIPGESLPTPDSCLLTPDSFLVAAAQKLLSAREALYPVTIHLLDLHVLEGKAPDERWLSALERGPRLNVVASSSTLEKLAREQTATFEALRAKVQAEEAEVCGGSYLERADPLLALDSQIWNLQRGLTVARSLLGTEIRVYARRRFGFHPQVPLLLSNCGIQRALFLCFDDSSGLPQYSGCVVAWTAPDGKQVDAFVRAPFPADNPSTFFNLGHSWFKTTREDHAATIVLAHSGPPAAWYYDLMELARLAPVFGTWTTFSRYFNEVMAGEHLSAMSADDFHADFLTERVSARLDHPVSAFAAHLRLRRRVDACWTYAALHHGLAGGHSPSISLEELRQLEDALERSPGADVDGLKTIEEKTSTSLAARLQIHADAQPGAMLLNPCAFARRVAVEQDGASWPLAVGGPVKACQLDGTLLRAVVEVPALGFAWIPREGPPGTRPMAARLRMGDPLAKTIRNEFFEAEVDPLTGGLKAIRDHKAGVNRLGQRLVFNPGSSMVARDIKVTWSGPALGEIISEGELLGEQNQVLATFKQRLRVWLGRPLLEMRIELHPVQPPAGNPWHAYFGSRFAWRDERALLMRGCGGVSYLTAQTRPQTPDFLEFRLGGQGTVIFPGGLPFHQRHDGRMLDIILQPEGEQATSFDLGIALDREMPMQTALGLASPVALVATAKGPPHVGASGWLFHLDAPNLLLTRLMPGPMQAEAASQDAVTARLLECGGHSGHAELRCVRDPKRAVVLDARGNFLLETTATGDGVLLEISPNDLMQVQVEFS